MPDEQVKEIVAKAKAAEHIRCVEYIQNYTPPKGYSPIDGVEKALLLMVAYGLYNTKE